MSLRPSTLKQYANRKISYDLYAFYRGWIQDIPLEELVDLYLDHGTDLRIAKSTIIWLRDTFCQAALRHGHRGEARLLRVHLRQKNLSSSNNTHLPTLEAFRETADPHDFYSEAELIELYKTTFPAAYDKKSMQRQRLIDRQLKALFWIQDLMVTTPNLKDPVGAWFDHAVAQRLHAAHINSINDLVTVIKKRGSRWWSKVPRIGEKGGARITNWIVSYYPDAVRPEIENNPDTCSNTIKTLFPMVLDPSHTNMDLSGSHGSNRQSGQNRIAAEHDMAAINKWLSTKIIDSSKSKNNTVRAYRKEAERFVLWSIIEKTKAISDLSIDDCLEYKTWLTQLGHTEEARWHFKYPQSHWIGKRNISRYSQDWRPFDGPLSSSSVKYALTTIRAMFGWLVEMQYLSFNPWVAVNKSIYNAKEESHPDMELTRTFSSAQWAYMINYLETQYVAEPGYHRLRFMLPFAYSTGLRLSELVNAKTGDLYSKSLAGGLGARWMLSVCGKGIKLRSVPMTEDIMGLLSEYLRHRGFEGGLTACPSSTPIIASLQGNEFISPSNLYKVIRRFFKRVSIDMVSQGRGCDSQAFKDASVHWIRHACGSHLGEAGTPVNIIQKLLGHANVATTSKYISSDEETLWQVISQKQQSSRIDR